MRTRPTPLAVMLAALALACAGRAADAPIIDGRRVDDITYHARTAVAESDPIQLHTTATVTNTGTGTARIDMPGGCPVLLRAYRTADRSGAPAWDQLKVAVCTQQLLQLSLEPGESETFRTRVAAPEILGDSLPPGRYHLTAVLRPDGGIVEVEAGSAHLAR